MTNEANPNTSDKRARMDHFTSSNIGNPPKCAAAETAGILCGTTSSVRYGWASFQSITRQAHKMTIS